MANYNTINNSFSDKSLRTYIILCSVFCGSLVMNTVIGTKIAHIGGLYVPAGIFLWSLTFPITDIVSEVYGKKYAMYFVIGGAIVLLLSLTSIQFAILLPSAPFWTKQEAYKAVLDSNTRTLFAAICSFLISQFADVTIFSWLRHKTTGRFLWLRNNVSTFISQSLACGVFLLVAFGGTISPESMIKLFSTNLIARWLLALTDTPIVYLGVTTIYRMHPQLANDHY
ncbi:queuosine precursor transporter [Desulfobacula toluolica]|uniref:Probable queuosine precursor transporter n=1 Tax=Desulfobacula toluolica (strain DSM 7467 / Tol2) TaxID=651182 RepID=K0NG85_DESTT|nr:queuosine precursor transporter [Desulfobacula toluolica]CCK80186.1 conserved uncharacterized integral membrane protein, DUF165 [Desulfobacula toluolica Tol2]